MNASHHSPSHSSATLVKAFTNAFLGSAPEWYKLTILAFLVINPIAL